MAEDVSLYLDNVFDERYDPSPNRVELTIPVLNGSSSSKVSLCGLLISEPTIRTANQWGPLIQNLASINDVSTMLGIQNYFTWIGASAMCWKGTSPLQMSLDFYLINYRRNLHLEEKLKALTKLTALAQIGGGDKLVEQASVAVHGGYAGRALVSNAAMFLNDSYAKNVKLEGGLAQFAEDFNRAANEVGLAFANPKSLPGSVEVEIGNKVRISDVLVSNVETVPSLVEVENGKPLFYRVSVGLTGVKPLLTTDVDKMYK